MNIKEESIKMHLENHGKIKVESKVQLHNDHDLAIAYTPGVAEPCKEIHADKEKVYDYTSKGNLVAVVSDGTAVLGLGNIGPEAAMPVMEGKSILFKSFAGVDAFPICLGTTDVDEIVKAVKLLEPTFGGINLEDIAAPACFKVEERLKKELNIPVFHDDQHGTAVVVLAGLINALKIAKKDIAQVRVVVNGAGAAAITVTKLLLSNGVKNVMMCDKKGIIYDGRPEDMDPYKKEMAALTNKGKMTGTLKDALAGADVFIGLSAARTVNGEMVKSMAKDAIVFAMANPEPEIMPDEAIKAGALVVATGRSDFANQINNVLAFPGIFRGALDVRACIINEDMKIAAAYAIADLLTEKELRNDYIIPKAMDPRVAPRVAGAVAEAAMKTGVAKLKVDVQEIEERTKKLASI
ncbi:MAG: ytsJ [Clostridia bacterium]|jgi:malate dehydrogenase (oxaloacetate-decarboxylating)|nr:ytsJ [Clostridia bacterium]